MTERSIILIGLRGSGKTSVGRRMADRLGWRFVDLDDQTLELLRSEHGVSTIAEAFARLGEATFRDAETSALERAIEQISEGAVVLALGGGTPTAPGASDLMSDSGAVVVYLRQSPAVLAERLRDEIDDRRPALTVGGDPITEIAEIYRVRDPAYRGMADIVLEVPGDADEIAGLLIERVGADTGRDG